MYTIRAVVPRIPMIRRNRCCRIHSTANCVARGAFGRRVLCRGGRAGSVAGIGGGGCGVASTIAGAAAGPVVGHFDRLKWVVFEEVLRTDLRIKEYWRDDLNSTS